LVGFFSAGLSTAINQFKSASKAYDAQVKVLAKGEKKLSGADLTKAARYDAQYRSAGSVKGNMLDLIDMVDITDSALGNIQTSLGKIRGYYLAGTAGTATASDRDTAQLNINSEVQAIDRISLDTEYNRKTVIFGTNNFNVQSGTTNGDSFTIFSQGYGTVANRGVAIRVTEEVGGNDRGTLVENVSGTGYALDETSVGSSTIRSYDNTFYATTASGTQKIDTMTSNVLRMRAQMGGYKSAASAIYNHMDNFENTMGDALQRIKGIDFDVEFAKLNEMQTRKDGLASLIASVNQSNSSVLKLLPGFSS
jgi:flagellin